MTRTHHPAALACILLAGALHANNIQLSSPSLVDHNSAEGRVDVRFNITWQNSWRTSSAPNNWDAAWVFIKYKDARTGLWQHARLHEDAGHATGTGTAATIRTGLRVPSLPFNQYANWGVGAFIYRSGNGTGTFSANNVELRWNYGDNGMTLADIAGVRVFALEMVYVPPGSFWVGSTHEGYYAFSNGPNPYTPFQITTDGAINIAPVNGSLWASGDHIHEGTLSASFATGYSGFYMMKHELSQQEYVDFLNTLTRTEQSSMFRNVPPSATSLQGRFMRSQGEWAYYLETLFYIPQNGLAPTERNGICCPQTFAANAPITFQCDLNNNGVGGDADDGQWIACNYLNDARILGYLDWSGLRPMTELEFEKACRGPGFPQDREFAWGNDDNLVHRATSLSAARTSDETGVPNNANVNARGNFYGPYDPLELVHGPTRSGMFARSATTRLQAGASYYGILDLSGNLDEPVVPVGYSGSQSYSCPHGDGSLSTLFPSPNPRLMSRGGVYRLLGPAGANDNSSLLVANREFSWLPVTSDPSVDPSHGCRGVRSLPQ